MDHHRIRTGARRALPRVGAAAAAMAVGVGSLVLTAGPAGAEPGDAPHACDLFGFRTDDGPLSDPVHHNIEPQLEPLLGDAGSVHQLNCHTLGYVDLLVENFTNPGTLPDILDGFTCLIPQILGGPACNS